ncbi:uncharacterized protein BDW43DRAFT_312173 [Aspergillus alliaceus]|uniref:uncharacterized protein n=1 Tax=Petromyces alliaceus TaxID=209559 RepID=UPI0012A55D07|nr:uncharacterized protein BDW43DRAFT_312173 [Aspergillus alliaceus]KAB8232500.1 hypothetical protein BDW43DRAFT_312173 [Aspergillus alliaceus]
MATRGCDAGFVLRLSVPSSVGWGKILKQFWLGFYASVPERHAPQAVGGRRITGFSACVSGDYQFSTWVPGAFFLPGVGEIPLAGWSTDRLYYGNLKFELQNNAGMAAAFLRRRKNKRKPPLPYTASPLQLLGADILLVLKSLWSLPGIILPLNPSTLDELDELYPSWENLFALAMHVCLAMCQVVFLLSLLVCFFSMVPALWIFLYAVAFVWANRAICSWVLNTSDGILQSQVAIEERPEHEREHWIFINGVAVGNHWLQNNIDRLAYTFGRRITGVHNPTDGLVFDIIECLIQRTFTFATPDTRDGYAITKATLLNPKYEKVVLILHSQGGIEGSLIIDWLLDELPEDILRKLEVYTFGNAANHFNNPFKSLLGLKQPSTDGSTIPYQNASGQANKSVLHIEHYVNALDFVCVWGVLQFASVPNRYMGRIFVRPGSGHQLNQHYLDAMFTLGPDRKVLDTNEFMEMGAKSVAYEKIRPKHARYARDEVLITSGRSVRDEHEDNIRGPLKVRDISRLWQYRNGGSPADDIK